MDENEKAENGNFKDIIDMIEKAVGKLPEFIAKRIREEIESNIIFILIVALAIIASILITYLLSKKKISREIIERGTQKEINDYMEQYKKSSAYLAELNLKYERGREDGKNDAISKYKESDEYKSYIEHETLKGIEQGKKEALKNYKDSLEFEAILNNKYYEGRKHRIDEALKEYKESPDFKRVLENEYRRGKEEGQKVELRKFSIKYDTWVDYDDGFFSSHYIDGYNMQLFYNNMPLGDPTRRVLTSNKKFKEENLRYLVDNLKYAVEKYIQISSGVGIPTQLLTQEPKKIESNLKVD